MKETFEKYESNVRSYCRKWPVEMQYAKGSIYKDVDGNEYIDFFDGAGALNYGHNPDYIKEKLEENGYSSLKNSKVLEEIYVKALK